MPRGRCRFRHTRRICLPALVWALAAASGALAGPLEVRGWVTTSDGTGLAGARVELLPFLDDYEVERLLLSGRAGAEPIATTTADAAGRFVLQAPGTGIWRVVAQAPGHVSMRFAALPLAEAVELPPVILLPAVATSVRFVDPAGEPLEGAAVVARTATQPLWDPVKSSGWRANGRLGWSDGKGALTFDRLRGEELQLSIFPAGRAGIQRTQIAGASTVTVATPPVRRRWLEIRDLRGKPLEGVMVAFGKLAWPLGLSGADGRLAIDASGNEALDLHLLTAHGRHQKVTLDPPGADATGTAEPTVITLDAAPAFSGQVVSAADGQPIAGALVWSSRRTGWFGLSDQQGRFRLPAPPSGWELRARSAGFLPLASAVVPGPENTASAVFPLEPAAAIQGRLVDSAGEPLAGVHLEAEPMSPAQRRQMLRGDWMGLKALSDDAGRFDLGQLDPQGTYHLLADREGFTSTRLEIAGLPLFETLDLDDIVLHRGRLLFGKVVDLDEQPIAEAEVRLVASTVEVDEPSSPQASEIDAPDPVLARTDATGRFELHEPPAETVDIVARGAGFAPFAVRGIELPEGREAVDLGTLILLPGAAVHGRVTDSEGTPIVGASLWVLAEPPAPNQAAPSAPSEPPAALAVDDGRFIVEDLEPGREVHLLGHHPGFLPTVVHGVSAPNETTLIVELQPAGAVSGEVVDSAGRPIGGAEIRLGSRETELLQAPAPTDEPPAATKPWYRRAVADERGQFTFDDVAPGPATLEAFGEGFLPAEPSHLEIAARAHLDDLRLVLGRGAVLQGQITSEHGELLADAQVQIGRARASSDEGGRYRLAGIPPGPQRVDVRRHGFGRTSREVEIEVGVQEADFVLEGGRRVAGRAVDEEGSPIEGVRVELVLDDPLEEQIHVEISQADGSFAWSEVADGGYLLQAEKEGYAVLAGDLVWIDGVGLEDLEVRLRRGAAISGRILGLEAEELARVAVRARNDEQPQRFGEIDYEGRYEIVDLAAGDWLLEAWLPGGSRQAEARVVLEPGVAEMERDLEFGLGLHLTGEVLYVDEPLPGTAIRLLGQDVAASRSVTTDFEGRFQVQDLAPGRYRIELIHRAEQLYYNEDFELISDRDLTIAIAASRVSGTVVSAVDSQPVAAALIALQQLLGPARDQEASLFTFGTDEAGYFSKERLTSGWYRLTVSRNGFQPVQQEIEVPAGFDLDNLQFELEPTDGLEVAVRLASGRRSYYVTAAAYAADGSRVFAESRVLDDQGLARFQTIPPGTWQLEVSATGGATIRTPVTVPGPPVELVLPDAGRLKVRIPALVESSEVATLTLVAPNGEPFRHLEVGGVMQQRWDLTGGKATLEGVPAGAWQLTAIAPTGQSWVGSAITTGGPDVEVSLE
ncbi:MAG: carboxypeptidase regulatory-like domain-containing protein [Acidobacteriota bacterium]